MKKTPGFTDDFEEGEFGTDLDEDFEEEEPFDDSRLDDQDDEPDDDDEDELSGLEVEELNMVEKGVSAKLLTSEQAREVAAFRRQELSINLDEHAIRPNEFQCEACFLVKRIRQRSSPGLNICVDCD